MNLLGSRNPKIYGSQNYNDLLEHITNHCKKLSKTSKFQIDVFYYQSNHEGEIVDKLQNSDRYNFIVLNAAAYSHYSIAIRDAIEAIRVPVVEVHMSDIAKRENFRQVSVISDVCIGTITGYGLDSYTIAIDYMLDELIK